MTAAADVAADGGVPASVPTLRRPPAARRSGAPAGRRTSSSPAPPGSSRGRRDRRRGRRSDGRRSRAARPDQEAGLAQALTRSTAPARHRVRSRAYSVRRRVGVIVHSVNCRGGGQRACCARPPTARTSPGIAAAASSADAARNGVAEAPPRSRPPRRRPRGNRAVAHRPTPTRPRRIAQDAVEDRLRLDVHGAEQDGGDQPGPVPTDHAVEQDAGIAGLGDRRQHNSGATRWTTDGREPSSAVSTRPVSQYRPEPRMRVQSVLVDVPDGQPSWRDDVPGSSAGCRMPTTDRGLAAAPGRQPRRSEGRRRLGEGR